MSARLRGVLAFVVVSACSDRVGTRSYESEVPPDASDLPEEVPEAVPDEADPGPGEPLAVPVGPPGTITAIALAPDYGERMLAYEQAERARLKDPIAHLSKLRAAAPPNAILALVLVDTPPAVSASGDALHDLAVVETIAGTPPGPRLRLAQASQDGTLGSCGTFNPALGERKAIFVVPGGAGEHRLVSLDNYYNGWFHYLGGDQFAIDRGLVFPRSDFAVLQGVQP